jgi:hypothetical protein
MVPPKNPANDRGAPVVANSTPAKCVSLNSHVPAESFEGAEKSGLGGFTAVVLPARPRSCVLSFPFLPADSVATRFRNLRCLPCAIS